MEHLPRRKLNPHLGVEIDCASLDLGRTPLTEEGAKSLFQSVVEHKVVCLRNTGLSTKPFQELARSLQRVSLEAAPGVPRKDELLFEEHEFTTRQVLPECPGVLRTGPFPSKNKNIIGNVMWHLDWEQYVTPGWMTCLRMAKIPRDPDTGEVIPCGDTMWADMTVAWEDLPEEDKALFGGLNCVYDWKVAHTDVKQAAERGDQAEQARLARLNGLFPTVERPFVRRHPVTGKMAILGDPLYVSHVVGMDREKTLEVMRKATRLCEVPEYQLRIPWYEEGDVTIHDNYAVKHKVVADFYHVPPLSRSHDNAGTKGWPQPWNVACPGVYVDDKQSARGGNRGEEAMGRITGGELAYAQQQQQQQQQAKM